MGASRSWDPTPLIVSSVVVFTLFVVFIMVVNSHAALEPGEPLYQAQHEFAKGLANNLYWLVPGGFVAALAALGLLAGRPSGR